MNDSHLLPCFCGETHVFGTVGCPRSFRGELADAFRRVMAETLASCLEEVRLYGSEKRDRYLPENVRAHLHRLCGILEQVKPAGEALKSYVAAAVEAERRNDETRPTD